MKLNRGLAFAVAFVLFACEQTSPASVTIIENGQVITLSTNERVPSRLLAEAGVALNANDRILANGLAVIVDQPIPEMPVTLQIRRAADITILTADGEQQIRTSAFTLGQALYETPDWLRAGLAVSDDLTSPISRLQSPISVFPAATITILADNKSVEISTSARTVGQALAEAGLPLLGLDYSIPGDAEPLPTDGRIRVVRVRESLVLAQKPILFESEVQASADVPLDQTQILQPGETGLSVQRIRIRYEDGSEVARVTENETVVRPSKNRILAYGTKVEVKRTVVDGVEIEYWRAVQMWATSYSPCRSGGDRCYPGTSSGLPLRKGVVGMRYDWYLAMGGQPLYIPGYGRATIGDVCGGCTGKPWIDLGYSDNDWQTWSSWVTVYFLTPVPSNIIQVLE